MFYRDVFALLCFLFFSAALATRAASFYAAAMLCGALSLTAKRKMWKNPAWGEAVYEKAERFLQEKVGIKFEEEEEKEKEAGKR